jgi:hypothetical protein
MCEWGFPTSGSGNFLWSGQLNSPNVVCDGDTIDLLTCGGVTLATLVA